MYNIITVTGTESFEEGGNVKMIFNAMEVAAL